MMANLQVSSAYINGKSAPQISSEIGYDEYLESQDQPPPPTFDDIDRFKRHITLQAFGEGLHAAAKAIFPNESKSRYSQVTVLVLSWEDEDPNLPVSLEISTLIDVFKLIYNFEVETWKIPDQDPHWALTQRIMEFTRPTDDDKGHLKIVYYAGHGRLAKTRSLVLTSWRNNKRDAPPSLQWSGVQALLEQAKSDVLILLDCCASGNPSCGEGKGVTELLSACAYNSTANGVGPYSFTHALVIELQLMSGLRSFSVGELYSNIFHRVQSRLPENGRERHPAPVHLVLTGQSGFPRSIRLCRHKHPSIDRPDNAKMPLDDPPLYTNPPQEKLAVNWALFSSLGLLPVQKNPVADGNVQTSTKAKADLIPKLAFAVRLKEDFPADKLSSSLLLDWLQVFPLVAKEVKIEAGFDSFSTLLIVSLPMSLSSYMLSDAAIIPLGPITSSNRLHICGSQDQDDPGSFKVKGPIPPSNRRPSSRPAEQPAERPSNFSKPPISPAHCSPSSHDPKSEDISRHTVPNYEPGTESNVNKWRSWYSLNWPEWIPDDFDDFPNFYDCNEWLDINKREGVDPYQGREVGWEISGGDRIGDNEEPRRRR